MEEFRQIQERLLSGSSVHPPMDIFESLCDDAPEVVSTLLRRAEALAGLGGKDFYVWLERAIDAAASGSLSFAFFGTAVYGTAAQQPQDIDVLFFRPSNPSKSLPIVHHKYFNVRSVFQEENPLGNGEWQPFVSHNLLLFPAQPHPLVFDKIGEGRRHVFQSPFLQGGVGDLLTHAIYKVLKCREEMHFEPEEWGLVEKEKFRIDRTAMDASGVAVRSIKREQLHAQVKSQLCEMADPQLSALAKAAMRRLRVKKEKRAALAERYMTELRQLR